MYVTRYGRFWAVYENTDEDPETLVCVTVYERGAREVMRRLQPPGPPAPDHPNPSLGPGDAPGPPFPESPTPRKESTHGTDR